MSVQEVSRELHTGEEMAKAYAIDQAMRLIREMDLKKIRLVLAFARGLNG